MPQIFRFNFIQNIFILTVAISLFVNEFIGTVNAQPDKVTSTVTSIPLAGSFNVPVTYSSPLNRAIVIDIITAGSHVYSGGGNIPSVPASASGSVNVIVSVLGTLSSSNSYLLHIYSLNLTTFASNNEANHSALSDEYINVSLVSTSAALPSLYQLAASKGINIMIGTAAAAYHVNSVSLYGPQLNTIFNAIVHENDLKWGPTEPSPGVFSYSGADQLISYTQNILSSNSFRPNFRFRGHNFAWHNQVPSWLCAQTASTGWCLYASAAYNTSDSMQSIMSAHIQSAAQHYNSGTFACWDVVNEAIADPYGGTPSSLVVDLVTPFGTIPLKRNLFTNTIGPGWIEFAFRTAAQYVNPSIALFYNDYNIEDATTFTSTKAGYVLTLIKYLKSIGIPIGGVGIQMHVSINGPPTLNGVSKNMANIAALGVQVQITEMDVSIGGTTLSQTNALAAQATVYSNMLTACIQQPACTAFMVWGWMDSLSWLGASSAGCLVDVNGNAKPSLIALANVLSNLPPVTTGPMSTSPASTTRSPSITTVTPGSSTAPSTSPTTASPTTITTTDSVSTTTHSIPSSGSFSILVHYSSPFARAIVIDIITANVYTYVGGGHVANVPASKAGSVSVPVTLLSSLSTRIEYLIHIYTLDLAVFSVNNEAYQSALANTYINPVVVPPS